MPGFLLILLVILIFGIILLRTPPQALARAIKLAAPLLMGAGGLFFLFIGRGAIGLPLLAFAIALYGRMRSVTRAGGNSGSRSSVRSAALEMTLDHDTGEMDGLILAGSFEGRLLEDMQENELIALYHEMESDEESVLLLEAYLDRRISGWREYTDTSSRSGQAASPGSGAMGEEEAYEVLGLGPGAGPGEIRKAHRRLMKGMHPDSGGSNFLAAKINEAKDVLLKSHS